MKNVGFIGGGRIVRCFLQAWSAAHAMPPRVVVSDTNPQVLQALVQRFPTIEAAGADNALAAAQDVVLLAVHPPVLKALLAPLAAAVPPHAAVVSLAPKLTMATLRELLGGHARLARMIPNAATAAGAGFNPLTYSDALTAGDRAMLYELFAPLGTCPTVPEAHLECYAVVAAMSLPFVWHQMAQLADIGTALGLPAADARAAVAAMARGAGAAFACTHLSCAEILDLVPVKPFAALEPRIAQDYHAIMQAIYDKIKP